MMIEHNVDYSKIKTFQAICGMLTFLFAGLIDALYLEPLFWHKIVVIALQFINLISFVRYDLKGKNKHAILYSLPYGLFSFISPIHSLSILSLPMLIKLKEVPHFFHSLENKYKVTLFTIAMFMTFHLLAMGWLQFSPATDESLSDQYIKALYWAVTTITTIGYGDITPETNQARFYTMFIMILGVGFYGFVIGQVSRSLILADQNKAELNQNLAQLALFMKFNKVPLSLQNEALALYRHQHEKIFQDNSQQILSELPKKLQDELLLYVKINLVSKLEVFRDLPTGLLKMISQKLGQKFLSPGEVIIHIGDEGEEMYILSHGEVKVYGQKGEVIAELEQGDYFGEIALLEKVQRKATVKAHSYCDVLTLSRENFDIISSKYPILYERIQSKLPQKKSPSVQRAA